MTFNLDRNILVIKGFSDRKWANITAWVELRIRFQFNSNVYFQWDTSKNMFFSSSDKTAGITSLNFVNDLRRDHDIVTVFFGDSYVIVSWTDSKTNAKL